MDYLATQTVAFIKANPGWAMLVIALTTFAESFVFLGLVLPGTAILVTAGTLVSARLLEPISTLLSGIVGAVLGYAISFWLGQKFGPVLPRLWPFRSHPELLKRGIVFFERHGGSSVFVGRFFGPLRAVIPMAAGMMRMPTGRFYAANVLSAVVWAPAIILFGAVLGRSLSGDENISMKIFYLALVAAPMTAVAYWVRRLFVVPAPMELALVRVKVEHRAYQDAQMIEWRCPSCRQCISSPGLSQSCVICGTSYSWDDGIWLSAPGFKPPAFSDQSRNHLERLETQHFWFPARRKLILHRLKSLLASMNSSPLRLIELGCGSGDFVQAAKGLADELIGVEGYLDSLKIAARRRGADKLIQADVCEVPLGDSQFDVVVALDVLEHLPADRFLQEAYRLAKPGGKLLLSVPAASALWSAFDEAAGHRCRYSVRQLRSELSASGWSLVGYTHYQCLLFPLFAISRLFSRRAPLRVERKLPRWLNSALDMVNDFEVRSFSDIRLPFGSSLVAWAEKPEGSGFSARE